MLCFNMIQKSLLLLGLIATNIAGVGARLGGGDIALSILQGHVTNSHHSPCDSPLGFGHLRLMSSRFVSIQSIPCGALLATEITVICRHFHVLGFNMVKDMMLLCPFVVTLKAGVFSGRHFVQVLHDLGLEAWGVNDQVRKHTLDFQICFLLINFSTS